MQKTETPSPYPQTKAPLIADFGIIFSVVICLGIVALGTWLTRYTLATPDLNEGGFFYEWQLANPDFWSRATVWIGFGLHQLFHWIAIWWAQERYAKYSEGMRPANWWALGINVVFIILHYFQTMFFYDGIAQDVPSWTAQFAVIMMLFVILAMENRRRGMFFGKKLNFRAEFYGWLKHYHGYAFSFAVIYTFWFHPMVPTWGHVFGFAYVILVMIQGSMMMTRMHLNRKWTFLLEILVLPHAALVAWNQVASQGYSPGLLRMFIFGFLTMFIVTQMHGLGLKRWIKYAMGIGFVVSLLIIYLLDVPLFNINEVIRIPAIEYGMVFVMYGGWWLFAKLTGQLKGARTTEYVEARASA